MQNHSLNNEQWQLIEAKYKSLFCYTARLIKGDNQGHGFEDKYQEIIIAAWKGAEGFLRKKEIEFSVDLLKDEEFDKYLKSCAWNAKSRKGAFLSKRYQVYNTPSLEVLQGNDWSEMEYNDEFIDVSTGEPVSSVDIVNFFVGADFNKVEERVLEYFLSDGDAIKPNGKINMKKLGESQNLTKRQAEHICNNLKYSLSDFDPQEI